MVNPGGPSKGCITCIRRKIRCGRQRPSCEQCRKSHRECEGYRSPSDTMFRDATRQTVVRASGGPVVRSQRNTGANVGRAFASTPTLPHSPRLKRSQGLEDFLLNQFIDGNSTGLRNNLIWVPENFTEVLKTDFVRNSLQSCGALVLARLQRLPEYFSIGHQHYSSALASLAQMWKREETLDRTAFPLTALFLGFFEVFASYDATSRHSWRTHLGGIGSMFETAEPQYMHTDFGARMFRMTRSQVLIHSLQTRTPVPETFARPIPEDGQPPHLKPFDDADVLIIRLANAQAQHAKSGASDGLISELVVLNTDCCEWMATLPSVPWAFAKQSNRYDSGIWWDERKDIYSAGFIAHYWNKIRAVRIVAYDVIQECLAAGLQVLEPSDELSSAAMLDLVTDIMATIPTYYRPLRPDVDPSVRGAPPALGTVFWFPWVLEIVGSMKEAPPELVAWIVHCFEWINECTGFVQPRQVARRLREGHRGPILP